MSMIQTSFCISPLFLTASAAESNKSASALVSPAFIHKGTIIGIYLINYWEKMMMDRLRLFGEQTCQQT